MNALLDMIVNGDGAGGGDWVSALLMMSLSLVLGHVVAWVYMLSHTGLSYSRTFVASLMVLPVIVSLVMMLMTTSLVVAFGLLAIFAVVRFRNVLKDTRDTVFVLWAIVEGMAVGTRLMGAAVVGGVFIGGVFLYMRLTAFGIRHRYDVMLSLQWAGPTSARDALAPLLKRHAARAQLVSQRGGDGDMDLSYRLLLRDPARSQELLDELQTLTGVEHASLYLREDESEI
ncbi:MAG: DUF4956 domain-containing protein [Planctomycetes bacterium]|nr:DUF4956 domain-containing protein [Planctomycetota bacterium]